MCIFTFFPVYDYFFNKNKIIKNHQEIKIIKSDSNLNNILINNGSLTIIYIQK